MYSWSIPSCSITSLILLFSSGEPTASVRTNFYPGVTESNSANSRRTILIRLSARLVFSFDLNAIFNTIMHPSFRGHCLLQARFVMSTQGTDIHYSICFSTSNLTPLHHRSDETTISQMRSIETKTSLVQRKTSRAPFPSPTQTW